MSTSLKDWIKNHVQKYEKSSIDYLSHEFFFRDPLRSCIIDDRYFSSPADGIILYQKIVRKGEKIIEVKGKNYTLKEVLGFDTFESALVIGIFMTFYDVHINRIPLSGYLKYRELYPLKSNNFPMLFTEKGIFKNDMNYAYQNMDYVFYNQRMVNTIYNPLLDYEYYLVQIADDDIKLIAPFMSSGKHYFQNTRFSTIRWGSQCDLVLPLDSRMDFTTIVPDSYHVEAGLDRLVKINLNKG